MSANQVDWQQILQNLPGGLDGALSSVVNAFDRGGDRDDDASKLAGALLRTQRLVTKLHRIVETLWDANGHISSAMGACVCWGTDRSCPRCGGYGTPGWLTPTPVPSPPIERARRRAARATKSSNTGAARNVTKGEDDDGHEV
jgi:hypothetical protein